MAPGKRWTRVTEKPAASSAAPALPGEPGAHRTVPPTTTVTPEVVEGQAAACAVAALLVGVVDLVRSPRPNAPARG